MKKEVHYDWKKKTSEHGSRRFSLFDQLNILFNIEDISLSLTKSLGMSRVEHERCF